MFKILVIFSQGYSKRYRHAEFPNEWNTMEFIIITLIQVKIVKT